MFCIFCPHICEELWEKIGNKGFISLAKWPKVDKRKINKKLEEQEKILSKTLRDIGQIKELSGLQSMTAPQL